MKKANSTNPKAGQLSCDEDKVKDSDFKPQFDRFRELLRTGSMTMKMASEVLKIDRANICRYVAILRKAGLICKTTFTRCKITGWNAYYLTTNLELCPKCKQYSLFEEEDVHYE